MDILIFGSGNSATFYIKDNKEYFENNIEILAFIDNNTKKQGSKFIEKEVISPNVISNYNYDAILICSVYEEEIYEQLVNEIGISKEIIYTKISFFEQIIFPWYDVKYDLYNKRILIVSEDNGTNNDYRRYYGRFCDLFCIVGIINLDNTNLIKDYDYDYILLANFDPLVLENNNCIDNNYYKIENILYNKSNLLTPEIVHVYLKNIKKQKYGEKYSEKRFLVIRINRYFMGLGAIAWTIAKGMIYAKKRGYIPIADMQTLETQYHEDGEYGRINAYDKFFEQPCGYGMDDIKYAKHVSILYDIKWYSKKEEEEMILPKMKDELYSEYVEFMKKFSYKKVLGVLFRGTDYVNIKPYRHNIQPNLKMMIEMVKKKMIEWGGFDLIYLCTEVQEACEMFEKEFGEEIVCFYPQLRYQSNTKKYLADISLEKNLRTMQGKNYWIALNCLASCHSLIAGQTTGTYVSLILNSNKYKNIYLFELGMYGVDDI
ncbi:MAG: hypothetical protein HFH68_08505 [Lachnospiraceae bacterium]|nr:hypothetical protein [Lachnospiraceae bacterium]